MPRSPRHDPLASWHHVMNRGAGRRIVFRDDADRLDFLDLVADLPADFGVDVHSFCLMGNHFHLLVRSREGRLSEAIGWLGSRFTRRANHRRGTDGPVFRGRFHSVLVDDDRHHRWLFRYVNANPVGLGWDRALADYPWSSFGRLVGLDERYPWVSVDVARSLFGGIEGLRAFVERSPEPDRRASRLAALPTTSSLEEVERTVDLVLGVSPGRGARGDRRALLTAIWVDALHRDGEPLRRRLGTTGDAFTKVLSRARAALRERDDLRRHLGLVLDVLGPPTPGGARTVGA